MKNNSYPYKLAFSKTERIIKKFKMFPTGSCIVSFLRPLKNRDDWYQFNKELEGLKKKYGVK